MAARHKPETGRLVVFAPDATLRGWIEDQFEGEPIAVQFADSLGEIVHALVEGEPPRPQILIADFDAIAAVDLEQLRQVRTRWFGTIIGLGNIATDVAETLRIERTVRRPYVGKPLRDAVREVGLDRPTTKMPGLT